MSDLFTEMIQEEFNKRITIGKDFNAWLKEEGKKDWTRSGYSARNGKRIFGIGE